MKLRILKCMYLFQLAVSIRHVNTSCRFAYIRNHHLNRSIVNKLFLASLFFCLSFTASDVCAQFNYGVKGGLNFSKGRFEDSETQFATGIHAGLFAQIAFDEKFYLKPELLYAQKGWKVRPDALNPEGVSIRLNYLNLPVLMGYRVNKKVSILFGPELGSKLSAIRSPASAWVDVIEKFDVGITAGSNFLITEKFGIDLRYIHGLKRLYKVEGRDQNNMPTGEVTRLGQNQAIAFGAFYLF